MTYVTADIHGNLDALNECLDKVNFDIEKDTLISLGDMVDGHLYSKQVVEKLMSIKNFTGLVGNHESFLLETYSTGCCKPLHYQQGGKQTMESYNYNIPKEHIEFIKQMPYYLIKDNCLFCHGGLPSYLLKKIANYSQVNDDDVLGLISKDLSLITWDRSLVEDVVFGKFNPKGKPFDRIYVGHTTTQCLNKDKSCLPVIKNGLYCLDTGAGWDGKLTFYCIETDKFYQSTKSISPRC
jgi:serine/threonine protein phosphatase 1